MSPEMTIVMLISAWLAVACAMLWGVMRIARRHHHPSIKPVVNKPRKHLKRRAHATAH